MAASRGLLLELDSVLWMDRKNVPALMEPQNSVPEIGSTSYCIIISFQQFFFFFYCTGSSLLCMGFFQLRQVGTTLQLQCVAFSLWWLLIAEHRLQNARASAVVVHGLSCPAACGVFPDQGLNPCPLHRQADLPLDYQGSPYSSFNKYWKGEKQSVKRE